MYAVSHGFGPAAGNRTSVIDGSGTTPYTSNNLNQYTAADGVSYQYDTSGNMTYDGHYDYGYDPENRLTKVVNPSAPETLGLSDALDSTLTYTTGGDASWSGTASQGYHDGDAAQSGSIEDGQESWMQTTVSGAGTVSFY